MGDVLMDRRIIKTVLHPSGRRNQRGNAIIMLFAAIGMAGVVTYGLNNIMRGPAVTTAEISRRTIAENNLVASTRLAIAGAAKNQSNGGDCDGDGFVEPLPYRAGSPAPSGGGLLPMTMGASLADPWGNQYGYCVWDPGTLKKSDNVAACGGSSANRLNGGPRDDKPAIAVISAGKNGAFETSCAAYVDNSTVMVNKPAASDDIVLSYTYAEANGVGAGEWKLKAADPNVAEVGKDLEVAGGASFVGALDTRQGGLKLPQDPGDDSVTGACDAGKDQQLRLNMSSDPPALEMCNVAGTGWTVVSGGGGAAPGQQYPTCIFPQIKKVAEVDYAGQVFMSGDKMFSSEHSGEFYSWNSSTNDPSTSLIDYYGPNPHGRGRQIVENGLMYVARPNTDAVWIGDLNNANDLKVRGVVTDGSLLNGANTIGKSGNHVAVTTYDSQRLTMVNVADPDNLVISGSVRDTTYLSEPDSINISGSHAFVTSRGSNSITAINISNPAAPVITSHLTDNTRLEEVSSAVIYKNYLIATSMYEAIDYITTIDITDPANMTVVASKDFPGDFSGDGRQFQRYGKYLFLENPDATAKIVIYDLSDPLNIIKVAEIPNVAARLEQFGVRGHYLQVTSATPDKDDVFDLGCDPLTGEITASDEEEENTVPDPLDTGLLAYWPMDEGTGTSVADASGNGRAGTQINTPQWLTDGPVGASALSFNGTDRDAVQVTGLLGSPQIGTVSLWVNLEDIDAATNYARIFSMGENIILDYNNVNGAYQFGANNGSTIDSFLSGYGFGTGRGWQHLLVSFDFTSDVFALYVDGRMVASSTAAKTLSYNGGTNTAIGRHSNAANPNFDFTGAVDDVRVYGRALGPDEVRRLYERSRASAKTGSTSFATAPNAYGQGKISVAVNSAQVCAIKADESLWCWGGSSGYGENGGAVAPAEDVPGRVGTDRWRQVSTGPYLTCGIKMDGTLWCWGFNNNGELGIGVTGGTRTVPTQVGTASNWAKVAANGVGGCAIKTDSSLWCWGRGYRAMLGQGNFTDSNVPVQVAGAWSSVAGSDRAVCGVKTDGTGWCWGMNDYGQTGLGTASGYQTTPAQIKDPGPWAEVIAGWTNTSCGIKLDGTAWCWGDDTHGRLGNGSLPTSSVPSPVASIRRFNAISVGPFAVCATAVDGSAWCWGEDSAGLIGNGGVTADQQVPVPVNGDGGWSEVVTGQVSCGLKFGVAYCWGADNYNMLGNGLGNFTSQENPFPVSNWLQPATMTWNDDLSIIVGNPGYNLALAGASLGFGTGSFGFSGPGRAEISQSTTANQLLIETSAAASSAQLSFKTGPQTVFTEYNGGLVGKWEMNDTSGTTVTALTGGNGTLLGGEWSPSWGAIGGSLYLNGSSSGVEIPNNAALRPTAVTVSAWIKHDGTQTPFARVVSKSYNNHTGPTYNSYALTFTDPSTPKISFEIGTSTAAMYVTSGALNPGWNHVVGSYNPSGTAPQMKIWVNGVLSESYTMTTAIAYDTSASTGKLFIGRNALGGNIYKGFVDDVRVYNFAADQTAVSQMYNFQSMQRQVPRTVGINQSNSNLVIARNNATATSWASALTPDMALDTSGLLGVGTAAPTAKVDVSGGVKFGADYDCSAAGQAGKVRYLATNTPPWQYCAGASGWTAFPSAGTVPWRTEPEGFSINSGTNCGLRASGELYCWGINRDGSVGDNTSGVDRYSPTKVHDSASSTGWTDWVSVSVQQIDPAYNGDDLSACGLRANGTVWCWGLADDGRLGDNQVATDRLRPVRVHDSASSTGWTDWVQISSGDRFHCGLRSNGTVWCWGSAVSGRLGNNASSGYSGRPVQVQTNTGPGGWSDWVQITSGSGSSCGIRANGSLWCWGAEDSGQLGNNQKAAAATRPVQVTDTAGTGTWSDWVKVSKGAYHTCGIRVDGSAYCWGSCFDGEIGNNCAGGDTLTPKRVKTTTNTTGWNDWVDISAGLSHSCGLRADGSAWCWGEGTSGILGQNSQTSWYVPMRVKTDANATGWSDWLSIKAGVYMTCGTRAGGTLWCWGDDWDGRMGRGVIDSGEQWLPMMTP